MQFAFTALTEQIHGRMSDKGFQVGEGFSDGFDDLLSVAALRAIVAAGAYSWTGAI